MARHRSEEYLPASQDTLSLSFLDVLSCGLGAATLLFLVFSVMPHLGTRLGTTAGQSENEGRANAVGIRTIDELVRYSVVFLEVRVKSPANAMGLVPSDPWERTLPAGSTRIAPTMPAGTGDVVFSAHISSGKQVKRPIKVRLLQPESPTDLVVEITAAIGGSTSAPPPITIKAADWQAANGVIATIDLKAGAADKWIVPAGVK